MLKRKMELSSNQSKFNKKPPIRIFNKNNPAKVIFKTKELVISLFMFNGSLKVIKISSKEGQMILNFGH
jgi:hypothetical protein